jgi:hypothetical protein
MSRRRTRMNKTALSDDENLVALYFGHVVSSDPTPKPASVASTLSAVSYFHKLGSHLDPTASFLIERPYKAFVIPNPLLMHGSGSTHSKLKSRFESCH